MIGRCQCSRCQWTRADEDPSHQFGPNVVGPRFDGFVGGLATGVSVAVILWMAWRIGAAIGTIVGLLSFLLPLALR